MTNPLESAGQVDDTEYLERINAHQARMIIHLEHEISFLRDLVQRLSDKALGIDKNPRPEIYESHEPIGGYVSLKDKILSAEETSRKEFLESTNASEE